MEISCYQAIITNRKPYLNTLYCFWNRIIVFYAESQKVCVAIQCSVLIIIVFSSTRQLENRNSQKYISHPNVKRKLITLGQ